MARYVDLKADFFWRRGAPASARPTIRRRSRCRCACSGRKRQTHRCVGKTRRQHARECDGIPDRLRRHPRFGFFLQPLSVRVTAQRTEPASRHRSVQSHLGALEPLAGILKLAFGIRMAVAPLRRCRPRSAARVDRTTPSVRGRCAGRSIERWRGSAARTGWHTRPRSRIARADTTPRRETPARAAASTRAGSLPARRAVATRPAGRRDRVPSVYAPA